MVQVLWLAAAGAVGAVARYGLAGLVQRHAGENFPAGTLVVNLAGQTVLGILLVWLGMAAGRAL